MTFTTALWAALAAIITGSVATWANPTRVLNRVLFFACGHAGCWFLALYLAGRGGLGSAGWLRVSEVLMLALPANAVLVQEAILKGDLRLRSFLRSAQLWILFFVVMSVWACTLDVVNGRHGLFLAACALGWMFYAVRALSGLRNLRGFQRMEYQILHLGVVSAAGLALGLTAVSVWLEIPMLMELMPLLVVILCAATTWALTSQKVLDARHILVSVAERLILVSLVVMFVWSVQQLAGLYMHTGTAYILAVATGLWFAAELHPWLRGLLRQKSRLSTLRRMIMATAGRELRPEAIEAAFASGLRENLQTGKAVLLLGSQNRLVGDGLELSVEHPAVTALKELQWVTPERLERKAGLPGATVLRDLMREHGFGLLVSNPGPAVTFVIALGTMYSKKPYTYPVISRLIEVVGTMENALSRARYLKQTQQAEQLATVGMLGASIAHEIRNPLVTIKTFSQLLPEHYQEQVFRDKFFRLIGDEVGRIDRLTVQLLDLSAPRVYLPKAVDLNEILDSCIDLIGAKADDMQIIIRKDYDAVPSIVFTDPNAVKQVMLNLGFNAIQALENTSGQRWIRVKTVKIIDNVEVSVEDSGPGIRPEVYHKLFQPFQSTKSTGFGLGLAICKDILSSVQASITVDPPVQGRGAMFRITIPCPRPTS